MLGEAGESGARLCLGCRQGREEGRERYQVLLYTEREKQKKRRLDKY